MMNYHLEDEAETDDDDEVMQLEHQELDTDTHITSITSSIDNTTPRHLPRHMSPVMMRYNSEKVDLEMMLTTATITTCSSTTPSVPGGLLPTKFAWSTRRAFRRVSKSAVAPIDNDSPHLQKPAGPRYEEKYYTKQQSSSCSNASSSSDRTTPSPPIALSPLLSLPPQHPDDFSSSHSSTAIITTDRSATLTDPVASTLLAQSLLLGHPCHQHATNHLVDDMSQLKLAAPTPVHAKPPPVPLRPTAIRPTGMTR